MIQSAMLRRSCAVLIASALLVIGCGPGQSDRAPPNASVANAKEWTCSMHPQVRKNAPGKCPICGMDLVPVVEGGGSDTAVTLSEGARAIASIEVTPVTRKLLEHHLRTVGRVEMNERRVAYLTARSDGRVEHVYADFTGVRVVAGDHLVDLYSPDLVVAQEELGLAMRRGDDAPGVDLARQKLSLLGMTKEQIDALARSGAPSLVVTVHAPIGGTVIRKNVLPQGYVKTGDPLYTIADLTTVWLIADVYEYELPWVALGQAVDVEVEALPGETFTGKVAFIEPTVTEETRTVRVRVELPNPELHLRPGMFGTAVIHATLDADGRRATVALPRFACPMHPDVRADEPGNCPICAMALVENVLPGRPPAPLLAVPFSAVLDTGMRTVVWIETEPGRFEIRPVRLGPRAGDDVSALEGVAEGDLVVTHGNFLVDSQAQISGKASLLFPKGVAGGAVPTEHVGHSGHAGH